MKDLKHYFPSPKGRVDSALVDSNKTYADLDQIVLSDVKGEEVYQGVQHKDISKTKPKKKKRKRKASEEIDTGDSLQPEAELIKESKKRKKGEEVLKSQNLSNGTVLHVFDEIEIFDESIPIKSEKRKKSDKASNKKKRDSSSSKENSLNSSEIEENACALTPESSKNLFSYFTKVDKLPDIPEKPLHIRVEAMIHVPSGSSRSSDKSCVKSLKKRRSKNKKEVIDYDLITTEDITEVRGELCESPVSSKQWKMRIQLSNTLIENDKEQSVISQDDVIFVESKINSDTIEVKDEEMMIFDGRENKQDDDIIFVKSEIKKENTKAKQQGTLASFFQIGNKKPSSVPVLQSIAKKIFLSSGTPDSIRNKLTSKSNSTDVGSPALYPPIAHIQQRDKMNILWNLRTVNFRLNPKYYTSTLPSWSFIIQENKQSSVKSIEKLKSFNLKAALKELKKELNLYPIGNWHKELKNLRKGKDGCMWSECYRPQSASTFLANTRNISIFKTWLSELKENSNLESCESSDNEFVLPDEKKKFDRKTVTLIAGPPGSGKTAAVYAVAEEIGYTVLELNASFNRSGKRLINEFSEALQSHKVGLQKLNFSKSKKKPEDPKRSLILIEDADLVFDDDEGFMSTLFNMAVGTKRPIILVANSSQLVNFHLAKIVGLCQPTLHFVPPSIDRLGSWLRTVSLIEGFHLSQRESLQLALSQDLRKSLLQLQLHRGKPNCGNYEAEKCLWSQARDCDLSTHQGRNEAMQIISTLSTLSILHKNNFLKPQGFATYWHRKVDDSTLSGECMDLPYNDLDDYRACLLSLVTCSSTSDGTHEHQLPRNLCEVEKDACSLTNVLNRRALALDFWPSLRQISRSESLRLASHTKRNNRYFNYLSSLGVNGPPDFLQSLSSTFS